MVFKASHVCGKQIRDFWGSHNTETEYTYWVFYEREAMVEWRFKKQNSAMNRDSHACNFCQDKLAD